MPMDANTATQPGLLREITTILRSARIRCWLRGGWALDFLVGEVTTPHEDIDLVTGRRHATRVRHALESSGYEFGWSSGVQVAFAKAGQEISILFVARDREGRISSPGIPEWEWIAGSLPLKPRVLRGISASW
ncbi:MAG: hypothetical protein C4321_03665 [Chloroflexota bacterium]